MSKAGVSVKRMVEGDQNKEIIYNCLLTKEMSRRECAEKVKLTKNQFTHYINFLVKEGHVKIGIGKCKMYNINKVHILKANKDYPFVARTEEQIQFEFDEEKRREDLIKPYVRVIKLLDSRPYNFHSDKKKKQKVSIQSSFNIL